MHCGLDYQVPTLQHNNIGTFLFLCEGAVSSVSDYTVDNHVIDTLTSLYCVKYSNGGVTEPRPQPYPQLLSFAV